MPDGAAGASTSAITEPLSADSLTIASLMTVYADPQARQALFTKWTTALNLPLRQKPDALCISRVTDATGTAALLIESPEPLSFVREVSATLTLHLPHVNWPPSGPPQLQAALAHLQFSPAQVTVPLPFAIFIARDLIVRVNQGPGPTSFSIYTAPLKGPLGPVPGKFVGTVSPLNGSNAALDSLRGAPDGAIALIRNKAVIAAIPPPGAVDKRIDLTVFDNGSETASLLLPSAPLEPGKYTLAFSICRARWRDSSSTDPESTYAENQSLDFAF